MPSFEDFESRRESIAIVGLGYVGLPLAARLAHKFRVIGFDIDSRRVDELNHGFDRTGEIDSAESLSSDNLSFTTVAADLKACRLIVVTVPTPITETRQPDLRPISSASKMVGENLTTGTTVVYESTVYPGLSEEHCIPILEQASGRKWQQDFNLGYSPERINPGDKVHTVDKITKIVAGDSPQTLTLLEKIYGAVVSAGTFSAESIRVAEAAKVIENTQRDLNIALMNELALIFDRLEIPTRAVLEAAGTKWNFLPFQPGLVGGHCIGVDPYYLTHKAESVGYLPQVILSGRRINDGMGKFIAEQTVKRLIRNDKPVNNCRVLILGFTFKENVPDIRNTRVIDIYRELEEFGVQPAVYDPCADAEEIEAEYGIRAVDSIDSCAPYAAILICVKHDAFREQLTVAALEEISNGKPVVIDVKSFLHELGTEGLERVEYWAL